MPLFELEGGRLVPAQFGRTVAEGLTEDVLETVRSQVLEIVARPLFPITWRDMSRGREGVGESPRLTALDATGQVVAVEVLAHLNSEALITSLSRLADAAALSWTDLASEYPGGIPAFREGWANFRDSMPPSPGAGPRLIMVVGSIDPQVRPALEVLVASGVEIHEISLRRMSSGRAFLDVAPVGPRIYAHVPQILGQGSAVEALPMASLAPTPRVSAEVPSDSAPADPPVSASIAAAQQNSAEEAGRGAATPASAPMEAPSQQGAATPAPAPHSATPVPSTATPVADYDTLDADHQVSTATFPQAATARALADEGVRAAQSNATADTPANEVSAAATSPVPLAPAKPTPVAEPSVYEEPPLEITRERGLHARPRARHAATDAPVARERDLPLRSEQAQSQAAAESAAHSALFALHEREMQVNRAREEGVPVYNRDAEGLSILARIIGERTPLGIRPSITVRMPMFLTETGTILVGGTEFVDPTDALAFNGHQGMDGWLELRLGDALGPSLAEALDEVNADIVREYGGFSD